MDRARLPEHRKVFGVETTAERAMSKKVKHFQGPSELFKLPIRGCYELAIVALAYSFKDGIKISNGDLAKSLHTHKRTIEKTVSRLKEIKLIMDTGSGKNDRCLQLTDTALKAVGDTELRAVKSRHNNGQIPPLVGADTALTYDHNIKDNRNKRKGGPPLPAGGQADRLKSKKEQQRLDDLRKQYGNYIAEEDPEILRKKCRSGALPRDIVLELRPDIFESMAG